MLIGEGWTAYLGMLTQIVSVAALLGTGVAVSWSFGREFTDATLSGLFALPTSASNLAGAQAVEQRGGPRPLTTDYGGPHLDVEAARLGRRVGVVLLPTDRSVG